MKPLPYWLDVLAGVALLAAPALAAGLAVIALAGLLGLAVRAFRLAAGV